LRIHVRAHAQDLHAGEIVILASNTVLNLFEKEAHPRQIAPVRESVSGDMQ